MCVWLFDSACFSCEYVCSDARGSNAREFDAFGWKVIFQFLSYRMMFLMTSARKYKLGILNQ